MNLIEIIFRGVDQITDEIAGINKNMSRMESFAVNAGKAVAGLFVADKVLAFANATIRASDEMQEMNEVLAQMRPNSDAVLRTQRDIAKVAIETDTAYRSTFELYARLSQANDRLKLSEQERLQVVEAINMAQQLAGPLAGDIAASFNRMLITGEASGRSLIQVFQRAPRLMKALEEETGKTSQELKQLGENGELTITMLTNALIKQSGNIREDFKLTGQTVEESVTNIGTAFAQLITSVDTAIGASDFIASRLQGLAQIINDIGGVQTKTDVVNRQMVQSGAALNKLLERRLELQGLIAKFGSDSPDDDVTIGLLNPHSAKKELEEVNDQIVIEQFLFDQLQQTFNNTKGAEAAADANKDVGESADETAKQLKALADAHKQMVDEMIQDVLREVAEMDEVERVVNETVSDIAQRSAEAAAETEQMINDLLADIETKRLEDLEKKSKAMSVAWDQSVRNMQTILANWLSDTEDGFKGLLRSFVDMLKSMVAQALAAKIMDAIFGDSKSRSKGQGKFTDVANFIGAFLGKPKAAGGTVESGMIYPVNENEPEFLLSANRGRVVPLSKMAANGLGGGRSMVYAPHTTIHAGGGNVSPFEFETILRRRDEQNIARMRQMETDGV